jgi:hypothetical protein
MRPDLAILQNPFVISNPESSNNNLSNLGEKSKDFVLPVSLLILVNYKNTRTNSGRVCYQFLFVFVDHSNEAKRG